MIFKYHKKMKNKFSIINKLMLKLIMSNKQTKTNMRFITSKLILNYIEIQKFENHPLIKNKILKKVQNRLIIQ